MIFTAVTSISPVSGSTDGGTVVTVTGQFTDPAGNTLTSGFECQWGTAPKASATVINGATLRCTAPPGTAGSATFTVFYNSAQWSADSLTFLYYSKWSDEKIENVNVTSVRLCCVNDR